MVAVVCPQLLGEGFFRSIRHRHFCTGTSIPSSSCSLLFWSLCHSNIFINMTVIIPPMTKHARLCQNCLPKNIFLLVSRDDAQEFRQEKRTKITNTQCRCLQSCTFVRFSATYVKGCFWLAGIAIRDCHIIIPLSLKTMEAAARGPDCSFLPSC